MDCCICIHGHFYQPPRENPWLEAIEIQDEAYPYHDWNERITAECYEPNAVSRILTDDGWIRDIVNNYSKISFNFGPTLLSWMEANKPEVYAAIIEADRESRRKFSGHGSAMAQAYNHMIMPLASRRDKYTQVAWGIRDFERRFGRKPEGMWLPETAVDLESLDVMAEQGINFTILADHQAFRVREAGGNWQTIGPEGVDTTMPYRVALSSGRTINVFFYNGAVSRAVAFERLLADGERFAKRLLGSFRPDSACPQLMHIATDGETYGHHHRHGDMALAFALDYITTREGVRLTNYAEYLALHPPTHEAQIKENSSWSCAHGIERWRSDCGCNSGRHPGWQQAWRMPLRRALDDLRDWLLPQYDRMAVRYLTDPWAARNDYIDVVLDRTPEHVDRWLARHAVRELEAWEKTRVLKLLEMQRHAMLMYTSCGWFFDDISGIETIQVLRYAGRVMQLAEDLFGVSPEPRFLEHLAAVKSNRPELGNGAEIYKKHVKAAMVDLPKVGAHYAISSLFGTYDRHSRIYCYRVRRKDVRVRLAGRAKLLVGKAEVTSETTRESETIIFASINFGNYNISAGVRFYQSEEAYQTMVDELVEAFDRAGFSRVTRLLDQHFGTTYSLRTIFADQQREILKEMLETSMNEVVEDYRRIYDQHVPLLRFLNHLDLDAPQPKALTTAAELVINTSLRQAFNRDRLDLEHIRARLNEAELSNIPLDKTSLRFAAEQALERLAELMAAQPDDHTLIQHLDEVVGLVQTLPFEVALWRVQNMYFRELIAAHARVKKEALRGDREAQAWEEAFCTLGEKLRIRRCKS